MSEPHVSNAIPRPLALSLVALIGLSLTAALGSKITGFGTSEMPPATAVESRDLQFSDRAEGGIAIRDAASGEVIAILEPGTNGFIRGVMRGFARERRSQGVDRQPPFTVTRWSDGRLSISDPETGRRVELDAFGPDNARAFARLLTLGGETQSSRANPAASGAAQRQTVGTL